jgi:membrane-bound serine protease (ClpP class)
MIHHPVVLGAKAILLLILAIVLLVLNGMLPPEQFRVAVIVSIWVFIAGVGVIWTVFFVLLKNPHSRLSRGMVLHASSAGEADEEGRRLGSLVGAAGVAETNLRPAGIGRFKGEFVDVLSNRGFIGKGAKIVVVKVAGKIVKVREA